MVQKTRWRQLIAPLIQGVRITWTWLRHTLDAGRRSLRGRLLYALGALLVLLLILSVEESIVHSQARRSLAQDGDLATARTAAAALRFQFDDWLRLEEVVAHTALGGTLTDAQVPAYLKQIQELHPEMASLRLVALDGRIIRGSPEPTSTDGSSQANGELFYREVMAGRTRYISPLIPGNERSAPRFQVAAQVTGPATSDGATSPVLAVVVAEFYDHIFKELLPEPPRDRSYVLIDANGDVALRSPNLREARWLLDSPDFQKTWRDRQSSRFSGSLSDGEEWVGVAVPVDRTGWSLALVRSRQQFQEALQQEAQGSFLTVLLVVLVFGTAIFMLVHISFRPVSRLSAAARRLGSGDFSLRLPSAEVREFEAVVENFNRMAEQLQAAREQLEGARLHLVEQVQERTRELEAEHGKLLRSERLSTVGLLSSAIAHDLRNPLNTVSLSLYALQTRLDKAEAEGVPVSGADPKVRQRLELAERELKRAEQIISTLLAFARTGEPNRAPTDLNVLVREVAEVVTLVPGTRIRLFLDQEQREVPVDRAQLFQVLENLLRNASQAMHEGGEVVVSTQQVADGCLVQIRDHGPGIPEEHLESIFEPLVTTKASGTGLGLALCKRVVDAHGGRITAANHPEGGAVFTMEFPLRPVG